MKWKDSMVLFGGFEGGRKKCSYFLLSCTIYSKQTYDQHTQKIYPSHHANTFTLEFVSQICLFKQGLDINSAYNL